MLHVFLCAFGFNFAPLRERYFTQRRKEENRKAQRKAGGSFITRA
jgi:hypothetical protein